MLVQILRTMLENDMCYAQIIMLVFFRTQTNIEKSKNYFPEKTFLANKGALVTINRCS